MSRNIIILLQWLLYLLFPLNNLHGSELILIRNKKPYSNIYLPNKSNKQLTQAVTLLNEYIFNSTGCNLKLVYSMQNSTNTITIATKYNGANFDFSQLDEDGFIIKTINNNIIISGATDWGTEFGVYDFLERFIGVKWLMPGKLWIEIPKKNTLTVPINTMITSNPAYLSRHLSPIIIDNPLALGQWGRRNRLKKRIDCHHNLYNIFQADKVKSSNPDFFPKNNRKRYIPKSNQDQGWQVNFKAENAVKYASEYIVKHFKDNPKSTTFSLGINDSGNFDENLKADGTNIFGFKNYSNDYYQWVNSTINSVNKTYPNKTYGLLAYLNVSEPPSFQLVRNVVPFLTFERLKWIQPNLKQQDISLTKKWKEKANEIGWYDYIYGLSYLVPRSNINLLGEAIKTGQDLGVRHYIAEFYPSWIDGPKGWILSKLLWNTNLDVDALLNEWCIATVGNKSAIYLKQYFLLWDRFWTIDIRYTDWWQKKGVKHNDISYIYNIPYDYILTSDKLLNQAYRNANTPIQQNRMKEIISAWELIKISYIFFHQNPRFVNYKIDSRLSSAKPITKQEIQRKIAQLSTEAPNNTLFASYVKSGIKYNERALLRTNGYKNNLISNGSFENGKSEWLFWNSNPKNGDFIISKNHKASGANSIQFRNIKVGTIMQDISYKPGDYVLIFKCFSDLKNDNGQFEIGLGLRNAKGERIDNTGSNFIVVPIKNSSDYAEYKVSFSIDSKREAEKLQLLLTKRSNNSNNIYIDDVQLYKVD